MKITDLTTSKLSPYMYNSKIACFQQCPMKYYLTHHCWLQPAEKPSYLTFGSLIHKAIENGLLLGQNFCDATIEQSDANVKDKELAFSMLDAFFEKWEAVDRKLIHAEQSMLRELSGYPSFSHWVIKADAIFEEAGELWIGDWKTTSGYGASTAKYYHESMQTKSYFANVIAQAEYAHARGTKIFVITKQKVRCEEETILVSAKDLRAAALYEQESLDAIEAAEASHCFPRYMTSCINTFGQECPYKPICLEGQDAHELVKMGWFKIESPDTHLELEP